MDVRADELRLLANDTSLAPTNSNRSLIGKLREMHFILENRIAQHPFFATFPWIETAGLLNTSLVKPPLNWPQLSKASDIDYGYPHVSSCDAI